MTLIKSISGIRGTIHDNDNEGLCSKEIKKCIVQFYQWLLKINNNNQLTIIVGRDGRVSGQQILDLISKQALELNINVINLGLTTTPSVQVAILDKKCAGGIMVSASHNPHDWNGLKLLNYKGEFLSKSDSLDVFNFICNHKLKRAQVFKETEIQFVNYQDIHLSSILELVDVDIKKIKKKILRL